MHTVSNVARHYICNVSNCCHPSCWEAVRKLINGILIFKAKYPLWNNCKELDIPHQLIYDLFSNSVFSDSEYGYHPYGLTNYAFFMKGRCEAQHNEILRNQEHTTININNQKKMETSEQYFDSSKEHLLALNLLRSELDKWNGVEDASSLKSPYIWIPPKKISDAQSKSLNRQKKPIKKGKGNLLFMLASGPERCQSFIQQISLIKTGSNQTQICDHNVQSGMDRIPNKTTCMPRWVTSCHISGQALKSRLLPLARAQIRRRIRRGSLILYPNGNNLESERISTKRSVNDAVALTTLSDTVNKHDRFDQQNSVLPEIIVQNQNLLYLNDSLKSEKTNLKQHQHTTPHFLNELLKAHQSDRRRRSYADIQLREQDKSKVKTHRLTDLLFFEQSEQVTAKKSPHYMDSVDSTQDLCMNRCCLSPINWPCLLNNNNSEMQETGYNLNEVILSLSSQKRNCTDCVMCPKNLVDGNKSPSHRNCSVEDISNSVAIWQKMPGRLLRRRTTQHGPSKQETFKNSKLFTDSSRQAGDTPKLSFVIENVYNQAKRMKSLPPDIYADMNDTATVAFSAVEDKLQQEFDGDNDRCKSNNSCWSSKRHPGYIERMHTICSMSNHKTLMKDNNYSGYFIPRYRRHFAIDKSSISELISLEPKTKSFLPQLRHSRVIERHSHKQMAKYHSCEINQVNSSTSLPMLIKPPPPSPDVKF